MYFNYINADKCSQYKLCPIRMIRKAFIMYLSKAICFTLKDWYFLQKNFMLSGEADKEKFEF